MVQLPEHAKALSKLAKTLPPGQAAMLLKRGVAEFPENDVLWGHLAAIQLSLRRPQEALDSVDRKLRLAPHDAIGWGLKTQILLALNQPHEALEAINHKLTLAPDNIIGWGLKTQVLLALNQQQDALEAVEQIHCRVPEDLVGWSLKVQVLLALNRPQDALVAVGQLHHLAPDDIIGWGLKTQVLLALNQPQCALEAANEKLLRDPNNAIGLGLKAICFLRTNAYHEVEDILLPLKDHPDDTTRTIALYISAIAALKQSEFPRAQNYLSAIQRNGFDHKSFQLWKTIVEAGVIDPERYLTVLDLAHKSGVITDNLYDNLVPKVPLKPISNTLVDSAWLEQQLQDQLSGMIRGEVARSKMFTTSLFPKPINRLAQQVGGDSRQKKPLSRDSGP